MKSLQTLMAGIDQRIKANAERAQAEQGALPFEAEPEAAPSIEDAADPVDVTAACPHCQSDRLTSWGTREQVFKDLPMHGKRVGIYIDTKRLRCQACGKTFSQALPMLAENRMIEAGEL